MAAANIAGYSAVIRTLYSRERLHQLLLKSNPFLGRVRKVSEWKGDPRRLNVTIGEGGGASATFADMQANISQGTHVAFLVSPVKDYSEMRVDRMAMKVAATPGATVDLIKSEGDLAMHRIRRSLGRGVWGNPGGALGVMASGTASETITLENPADIYNFAIGMVLESFTGDGTAGGSSDGVGIAITGIDYDAGTITKAAGSDWGATAGSFDDGDHLFRQGDFGIRMTGVQSWLPSTAPVLGSDTFHGLDRGVAPTHLAGHRIVATVAEDGTIANVLDRSASIVNTFGGVPDEIWMNPRTLQKFAKELGDAKQYVQVLARGGDGKEIARVSYTGIKLLTAFGEMDCLADPSCPTDTAFMLQSEDWSLESAGEAPHWVTEGEGKLRVLESEDSLRSYLAFYGNLICEKPLYQARIDLSELTDPS